MRIYMMWPNSGYVLVKALILGIVSSNLNSVCAQTISKPSSCGDSTGCFHNGCTSDDCEFLLKWQDGGGDDLDLTLTCIGTGDKYCAIGLSSDSKMASASVIECVSTSSTPAVYVSYNTGYSNSRLSQNQLGLTLTSSSHTNGIFTCTFKRKKTATLASASVADSTKYFDMNSDWTLLYAYGSSSGGSIQQHSSNPCASLETADFQSSDDVGCSATDRPLVKLHGILMSLVWMLFAHVGVFMASINKQTWPDSTLWFGLKPWFVPIMAAFRPKPDHPRRIIFRIAHTLVGYLAIILATVNLYTGASLSAANAPASTRIVLIVFNVWIVVVPIAAFLYLAFSRKPKQNKSNEVELEPYDSGQETKEPLDNVRVLITAVYVVGLLALSIAFWVLFAGGK
ncbi:FRRS1-like protein [Mya arenaria]|uniref:FRRS1-like protein n=1 Tax=Mya arenaria TaxID=6604 RepID=A0ABY7E2H6_MYAAR|nr:FRRS1-like protein [Mya arenaria]